MKGKHYRTVSDAFTDTNFSSGGTVRTPRTMEAGKTKMMYSTWSPLAKTSENEQLFNDRRDLIYHWFDLWNDLQRKRFVFNLLTKCDVPLLRLMQVWINEAVPPLRSDFANVLPSNISTKIFGYLDPQSLCRAAQVNLHWRYLTELDDVWIPKCTKFGWFLPYEPGPREHGAWKAHYLACTHNLEVVQPSSQNDFLGAVLKGNLYDDVNDPPKKLKFSTSVKISKNYIEPSQRLYTRTHDGRKDYSLEYSARKSPRYRSESTNFLMSTSRTQTRNQLSKSVPDLRLSSLHTYNHQKLSSYGQQRDIRIIFISTRVKGYELLLDSLLYGVLPIVYEFEGTTLEGLCHKLDAALQGCLARSIGFVGHFTEPSVLHLVQGYSLGKTNLQTLNRFFQCLGLRCVNPGGHLELFAPFGAYREGRQILSDLQQIVDMPVVAPLGFLGGQQSCILSPWTASPESVHPPSLYFNDSKLSYWAANLEICSEAATKVQQLLEEYFEDRRSYAIRRMIGRLIFDQMGVHKMHNPNLLVNSLRTALEKLQNENETDDPMLRVAEYFLEAAYSEGSKDKFDEANNKKQSSDASMNLTSLSIMSQSWAGQTAMYDKDPLLGAYSQTLESPKHSAKKHPSLKDSSDKQKKNKTGKKRKNKKSRSSSRSSSSSSRSSGNSSSSSSSSSNSSSSSSSSSCSSSDSSSSDKKKKKHTKKKGKKDKKKNDKNENEDSEIEEDISGDENKDKKKKDKKKENKKGKDDSEIEDELFGEENRDKKKKKNKGDKKEKKEKKDKGDRKDKKKGKEDKKDDKGDKKEKKKDKKDDKNGKKDKKKGKRGDKEKKKDTKSKEQKKSDLSKSATFGYSPFTSATEPHLSKSMSMTSKTQLTSSQYMSKSAEFGSVNARYLSFDDVELGAISTDPRGMVAKELLSSELLYNRTLRSIRREFVIPLRQAVQSNKPIIQGHLIQLMFADVMQLLEVSKVFVASLSPKVQQWNPQQCIGDSMLLVCTQRKVFINYLNNYNDILDNLNRCQENSPEFRSFMDYRMSKANCALRPLHELFLAPLRRFTEYCALLVWLQSETQIGHEDTGDIAKAHSQLLELERLVRRFQQRTESSEQLRHLQQMIVGCPALFPAPSISQSVVDARMFLLRMDLSLMRPVGYFGQLEYHQFRMFSHVQEVGLFLLSDCLLICRKQTLHQPFQLFRKTIYRFQEVADLSTIQISELPDTQFLINAIQLQIDRSKLYLRCRSQDDKYQLVGTLQAAIDSHAF